MKTLKSYFKIFTAVMVGVFILASCEDSIETPNEISSLTEDEAITLVESNDIGDEIDNIIDEILIEELGIAGKEEAAKNDNPSKNGKPDCVTKEVEDTDTGKIVTLDFGEGCEMKNGHILKGILIMTIEFDFDEKTKTVTHTYDGFYVDDVLIEGYSTIIKKRSTDEGNPLMTIVFEKTMTWPENEKVVTRTGTKYREWIAGYNNNGWGDNVHLIWGSWSTTMDGVETFSTTISEETPLERKFSCKYIVSGVSVIIKNGEKSTIDFGDGTCDNIAMLTKEGEDSVEITLKKRKRTK